MPYLFCVTKYLVLGGLFLSAFSKKKVEEPIISNTLAQKVQGHVNLTFHGGMQTLTDALTKKLLEVLLARAKITLII